MLHTILEKAQRLIRKGIIFLLKCYRLLVSPCFRPCCRFFPSCSSYARQAFAWHPVGTAFWLVLKRLLRCRPFSSWGYDPVPPPTLRKEK